MLPKLPMSFYQFSFRDDVVCRTVTIAKDVVTQLVPVVFVDVFQLLHEAPLAGHPGRDKTLAAALSKSYWPIMRLDIEKHVSRCLSCAQTKGSTTTASILEYPLPAGPFDAVDLALLQLPRSSQGSGYILVCVDHLSRFVVLGPFLRQVRSDCCSYLCLTLDLPIHDSPSRVWHNGMEFKNQVLADICSQYGVKQTFITAHNPASNGIVERKSRKILEILKHLSGRLQETWEDWLSQVAAYINCSVNSSTGKTPHYIFLGVTRSYRMMCFCNPPLPCITSRIILRCSSIASKPFMLLFLNVRKLQER